jgi:hypothetical protein
MPTLVQVCYDNKRKNYLVRAIDREGVWVECKLRFNTREEAEEFMRGTLKDVGADVLGEIVPQVKQ